MPRFERPEPRLRHLASPPPPPPSPAARARAEVGRATCHVAIGVVLGAVASLCGTLVARLDGHDIERGLAWSAPSAELRSEAAAPPARVPDTPMPQTLSRSVRTPSVADPPLRDPAMLAPALPPPRPVWMRGVPFTTLGTRVAPAVDSPDTDLALAPRGARVVGASPGWGGGSHFEELLDGHRTYDDWAHGYAFGGGPSRWNGEECGERFVEIELAEVARVERVVAWHHGREHVPAAARTRIEALDADGWRTLPPRATTAVHASESEGWWTGWSTPVEHRVAPVTTRRVRYVLDNCEIEHGWLYEIEVYAAPDEPS